VLRLRSDTPTELARIVDDALAPEHPTGHRTAGDLRDALTAFLWNERKSHCAAGNHRHPACRATRTRPG